MNSASSFPPDTAPDPTATILIVDDNAANRDTLVDLLAAQPGLRLLEAADGPTALQQAADSGPDLVLLDVMMPGMDGYEVCRRLRADPRLAEVPVIMITALDDQDSRLTGIEAGADDFITKPFNRVELRARVRSITRLNRYRRLLDVRARARESETRLQKLAEHSDEVFWFLGMDPYRLTYVSPSVEALWKLTQQELYAAPHAFRERLHPNDRERVKASWDKVLSGKTPRFEMEYRIVVPEAGIRWVESSGTPIFDAAGTLTGIGGVMRDITGRKLAEERIREQAGILDQAPLAVVVAGLDHRVSYCNLGACELLGLIPETLLGRTAEEIFITESMDLFGRARAETMAKGRWSGEIRLTTKAGRVIQTEYHMFLLTDAAGQPKARLNVIIDITEKKKLEDQFLRAQRLESLGMLAAGIAHDLNNVLAPILMGAPLLRMRASNPADLRMLDTLEASAARGASLVRQILSFCHGTDGGRVAIQPKHVLRDICGLIEGTFPKNIRMEADIPNDLWTLEGNPTQLHQVLLNLCVNARDAMPGGGELRLKAENRTLPGDAMPAVPDARPGNFILLEVADTGDGIPPEILARIWEPFFTTKGQGKGTGLGLSTVRGIVARFGGFIEVESAPGKGTIFRIFLPSVDAEPRALENGGPSAHSALRGKGELLLVVDDEAPIRDLIGATLGTFGYRILSASNGIEAVERYVPYASEVALVVTDVNMPEMGGGPLARALAGVNPEVKTLFMSGTPVRESHGLPANARVLAKPFTTDSLLAAVRDMLADSAGTSVDA